MDWAVVIILGLSVLTGVCAREIFDSHLIGAVFGFLFYIIVGFFHTIISDARRAEKWKKYNEWKFNNIGRETARSERTSPQYSNAYGRVIKIHRGIGTVSEVVFYIVGNYIHEGNSDIAPIAYCIDGNNVRKGSSTNGEVAYYVDGHNVHEGISSIAPIKYYIDGNNVHEGSSTVGPVAYYIEW